MSKKTAVDVYHDQIKYLIKMGLKLSEPDKTFLNSAYRDCKAMEREQIIDAHKQGEEFALVMNMPDSIEYYDMTYKGCEQ